MEENNSVLAYVIRKMRNDSTLLTDGNIMIELSALDDLDIKRILSGDLK